MTCVTRPFTGNEGDDYFRNNTSLQAEAKGGNGNDTLWGGWRDDKLYGGNGSPNAAVVGGEHGLERALSAQPIVPERVGAREQERERPRQFQRPHVEMAELRQREL